jgi:hypothetical protein
MCVCVCVCIRLRVRFRNLINEGAKARVRLSCHRDKGSKSVTFGNWSTSFPIGQLQLNGNISGTSDCFIVISATFTLHNTACSWPRPISIGSYQKLPATNLLLKTVLHSQPFDIFTLYIYSGPGTSVGIVTGYGPGDPEIESRWERDFPHLSRPALRPTQPPVQWGRVFLGGRKRPGRDADPSPASSAEVWKQ